MKPELKKLLKEQVEGQGISGLNELRAFINSLSPFREQPVDKVIWVPLEKVKANSYNPNRVAADEMKLLYVSIDHDGYTQPVVTAYDPEKDEYIIVDGFHRYFVMRETEIRERTQAHLPVVVINKDMNDRMASTIRHNRARGKHTIQGMSSLVFAMLEEGWNDSNICNELGMEAEELLRLKHITGFSKLFKDAEYNRAWKERNQIIEENEYKKAHGLEGKELV